ncbi:extracellular solute-binding protein [Paenibacillus spongiae]|uniref:Extracellular solute-binding protein n=1 Tax=Paenibacillus spongiae TaxID=2909671 RepID=A0ABY5S0J8_9BACL|nr:extracellular solute-binding protein [Paenibacillus spongiae]UVI27366.1 extracellular solute-binding protein [Paenibacillus spongiae]
MKKGLVLLLSLLLVTALMAACTKKEDSPKEKGAASEQPAAGDSGKQEAVKFTISTSDPKLTWDTPVGKLLTEKTGVSLEYVPVLSSDTQKYDIWLASGDYPDIVTSGRGEKYRDAGAYIPLEDLIDQYGPNIKKKFGKFYDLLRDEDGHIYTLYNVNLAEETPANVQASFAVQYDVLKEAGYPEIKTLDQLYDVLKAYTDKHPTVDGQEVIPFSGAGPDLTFNNPAINAAGHPDHGRFYIDEGNNVHSALSADFTKDYFKFLNKLQSEGMLDKEIFSLNYETLGAKIAQGRVLAGYIPQWVLSGPEQSLVAAGQADKQYAKLAVYFNDQVVDHSNTIVASGSNNNWGITTNAKNPERIIQFVDYLFSDEGQKLINWGIEGQHYDVVEGKRVRKQEFLDKLKADPDLAYREGTNGIYSRFSFGDGAKLDDGDYATPITADYIASNYDEETKGVLSKYGKKVWADFMPKPEYLPAYLWQLNAQEEVNPIFKKLENIWVKETPRVIMAKSPDEFEKAWSDMVAELDKGGEKRLEQLWTDTWQQYSERYNEAVK